MLISFDFHKMSANHAIDYAISIPIFSRFNIFHFVLLYISNGNSALKINFGQVEIAV